MSEKRSSAAVAWMPRYPVWSMIAKYGPSLGPEPVMRCIADAMGHFDGARIRTYVMLLVERRATEQLRDEARRVAVDAGDVTGRAS